MAKLTLIPQAKGGFKDRAGRLYTQQQGEAMLQGGTAVLAQWKGKKKAAVSYEGGQYTGGRKKKTPNLKYTDKGIENQHGVVFSEAEKKALENAVNKANYRRKQMIKQEKNLPMFVAGRYTGYDVSHRLGSESDFVLARKSKSLQGFKTRRDYDKYMRYLENINNGSYLDDRIRLYKRNHMAAIQNVFGDDAKDVVMKIRMMKPGEYMAMVQSDEMLEVSYVYDPSQLAGKLNQIRAALGMKQKEEPV